jgi:LmbE family N-acetylglucosaminyl deacetylase
VTDLEPLPEDWDRALAVVAHPDDMEYGAASAVARWTAQGKWVGYVLVTEGEAGIESMPPEEVAPIRRGEQEASCAAVGVTDIEYLGHPDGLVVNDLRLRADIAAAIRRHRPDVILSINFRDSWGGPSWNHVDHRVVGVALLDAVRDAANPWVSRDRGEPWSGVRFVAFNASPQAAHGVDVSDHLDAGIASLSCHRTYLENLDGDTDTDAFLRGAAEATGQRLGVDLAVAFEVLTP